MHAVSYILYPAISAMTGFGQGRRQISCHWLVFRLPGSGDDQSNVPVCPFRISTFDFRLSTFVFRLSTFISRSIVEEKQHKDLLNLICKIYRQRIVTLDLMVTKV